MSILSSGLKSFGNNFSGIGNKLSFGSPSSQGAEGMQALSGLIAGDAKVPQLEDITNELYTNQNYTPEQLAYLGDLDLEMVSPTELRKILTNPEYERAQSETLNQLDQISKSGVTDIDRARLQEIQNQMASQNKGNREAILQGQRQRGMGGSGSELATQLLSQQDTANQGNSMGMDVNAQAQSRALQALTQRGDYANQLDSLKFSQESEKAQAQDLINRFNNQNRNTMIERNLNTKQDLSNQNIGLQNGAQYNNLMNKQNIGNQNVDLKNQQMMYNKVQKPTSIFDMTNQKNQALASGLSGAAQMNQAAKTAQYQGNMGLAGATLQAGGTLGAGAFMSPNGTFTNTK